MAISENSGTSLWKFFPKLRTIATTSRSRCQQHSSSSSTVEFVDDTYTTIDESWLFTASRSAVTLSNSITAICCGFAVQRVSTLDKISTDIFGRIGRMASENVILELIKTNSLPILLYCLEVCPLSKTNLRSLDFPINRFFMKLFNTSDMQTVTECQSMFDLRLPSVIISDRCKTFRVKYVSCSKLLYKLTLSPL